MHNTDEESYSISIDSNSIFSPKQGSGGTIITSPIPSGGINSSGGNINWPNYNFQNPLGQGSTASPGLSGTLSSGTLTANITASKPAQMSVTFSGGSQYDSVGYTIIQKSGGALRLVEKKTITPREMIGLSKFFNTVSAAINSTGRLSVNWSALIKTLKIEDHFQQDSRIISTLASQPTSNILEIKLYDPT